MEGVYTWNTHLFSLHQTSIKRVCGFFSSQFVKNQVPRGGCTWLWVLDLVWVTKRNYFCATRMKSFQLPSMEIDLSPALVWAGYFSGMFVPVGLDDPAGWKSRVFWAGTFPHVWVEVLGYRWPITQRRAVRRGTYTVLSRGFYWKHVDAG